MAGVSSRERQATAARRPSGLGRLRLASCAAILALAALFPTDQLTEAFVNDAAASAAPGLMEGLTGMALGGTDAQYGRYPYIARLMLPETGPQVPHICGGVLIAPSAVLSAAHCLEEKYDGHPKPDVRVGDDSSYQTRQVADTKKLPFWTNNIFDGFDLAILFLAEPVYGVKPANVVDQLQPSEIIPMIDLWGVGWGYQNNVVYDFSAPLQQVPLPYLTNAMCSSQYVAAGYGSSLIKPDMMCAGGESGQKVCKGDSGGPLIMAINNNPEDDIVVGILSFGQEACTDEANLPGVFTRLNNFVQELSPIADPTVLGGNPSAPTGSGGNTPTQPWTETAANPSAQGGSFGASPPVGGAPEVPSFCSSSPCSGTEEDAIAVPFCSESKDNCENTCQGNFCPLPVDVPSYCTLKPCSASIQEEDEILVTFCKDSKLNCEGPCQGNYCAVPAPEPVPSYCSYDPCSQGAGNPITVPFCSENQQNCEGMCSGHFCPLPEEVPSYCRSSPCSGAIEDQIPIPFCSDNKENCEGPCQGTFCPIPQAPVFCAAAGKQCSDDPETAGINIQFCNESKENCEELCGGTQCG